MSSKVKWCYFYSVFSSFLYSAYELFHLVLFATIVLSVAVAITIFRVNE